jgi:hypothetical protein
MSRSEWQVVLEVGAEGGRLTIYGLSTRHGWRFSRQTIDDSAAFLGEPREQRESDIVDSWEKALELLRPYPWQKLYPLEVHPEFRERVFSEVLASCSDDSNPHGVSEWKALCGIVASPPAARI